jgi:hypothetical protein
MTLFDPPSQPDDSICWQCGAPADPGRAYKMALVARAGRGLETLGYPVTRRRSRDTIRVPIPRCRACQNRNRLSVAMTFVGLAAGAIAGRLARVVWPGLTGGATAIGAVVGVVVVMFAVAYERKRSGRRPRGAYPPIVKLRQAGWSYPGK